MDHTSTNLILDNERRALEGEAAVLISSDALANDAATAASDTIANILHFMDSIGINPDALIEGAKTCYYGDLEDGPTAKNRFPVGNVTEIEFQPRADAVEMARAAVNRTP